MKRRVIIILIALLLLLVAASALIAFVVFWRGERAALPEPASPEPALTPQEEEVTRERQQEFLKQLPPPPQDEEATRERQQELLKQLPPPPF